MNIEQLKLAAFVQGARDKGKALGMPENTVDSLVNAMLNQNVRVDRQQKYDNVSLRPGKQPRQGYSGGTAWGPKVDLPYGQSNIPGRNW